MHIHLGENRMLVSGGLYDQPLEWFVIGQAGYYYDLLKRIASTDDWTSAKFTTSEMDDVDEIAKIRTAKRG